MRETEFQQQEQFRVESADSPRQLDEVAEGQTPTDNDVKEEDGQQDEPWRFDRRNDLETIHEEDDNGTYRNSEGSIFVKRSTKKIEKNRPILGSVESQNNFEQEDENKIKEEEEEEEQQIELGEEEMAAIERAKKRYAQKDKLITMDECTASPDTTQAA